MQVLDCRDSSGSSTHNPARYDTSEYLCIDASHKTLPSRNGPEKIWWNTQCGLHRGLPTRTINGRLLRIQSIRPLLHPSIIKRIAWNRGHRNSPMPRTNKNRFPEESPDGKRSTVQARSNGSRTRRESGLSRTDERKTNRYPRPIEPPARYNCKNCSHGDGVENGQAAE